MWQWHFPWLLSHDLDCKCSIDSPISRLHSPLLEFSLSTSVTYVYSISVWMSSLSHQIACLFLVFQSVISAVMSSLLWKVWSGFQPEETSVSLLGGGLSAVSGWCRCSLICTTLALLPSVISTFTGLLMLCILHFPSQWDPIYLLLVLTTKSCLQHQSVVTVNGCHTLVFWCSPASTKFAWTKSWSWANFAHECFLYVVLSNAKEDVNDDSFGCLPNIITNGETPVDECTAHRYAISAHFRWRSQSSSRSTYICKRSLHHTVTLRMIGQCTSL